jgi:hypothetical protein
MPRISLSARLPIAITRKARTKNPTTEITAKTVSSITTPLDELSAFGFWHTRHRSFDARWLEIHHSPSKQNAAAVHDCEPGLAGLVAGLGDKVLLGAERNQGVIGNGHFDPYAEPESGGVPPTSLTPA